MVVPHTGRWMDLPGSTVFLVYLVSAVPSSYAAELVPGRVEPPAL